MKRFAVIMSLVLVLVVGGTVAFFDRRSRGPESSPVAPSGLVDAPVVPGGKGSAGSVPEQASEPCAGGTGICSGAPMAAEELRVISPESGDPIDVGADLRIRWYAPDSVKNVNISLCRDGLKECQEVAKSLSAQFKYLDWTIPAKIFPGTGFQVVVADTLYDRVRAVSKPFSIVREAEPQRFIRVVAPNGGESLSLGKTFPVRWGSRGVKKVEIEICYGSESDREKIFVTRMNCENIASGVPAYTGEYAWTISIKPKFLLPAQPNGFWIRTQDEDSPKVAGMSEGLFRISGQILEFDPGIAFDSDTVDVRAAVGDTRHISWLSFNVPLIDMYFCPDSGAACTIIGGGIRPVYSLSGYEWVIDSSILNGAPSVTGRIKVAAHDDKLSAVSSNKYTIVAQ